MIDEYISAIIKIANHYEVKKYLEPHIMKPQNVQEWQVKRILLAEGLLLNELQKDTGGTVQETPIPNQGPIHSDT